MGAYRFLGRALIAAGVLFTAGEASAQDACITDVTATAPGVARTFRCAGGQIDFLVAVPPGCTEGGCGMIVDLPGATQSAEAVNTNTGLRQRARNLTRPFIVINAQRPVAGLANFFNLAFQGGSADEIFAFMQRAANVFRVDRNRIHIGGFSQGGILTFNFLCSPAKAAFIASAAPAAASPVPAASCLGTAAQPSVPILYFSGRNDMIAAFPEQQATAADIVQGLAPITSFQVIAASAAGNFRQIRIRGVGPRDLLELVRYDNTAPGVLGGHCFLGPFIPNGGGCDGPAGVQNGAATLLFYMNNPRR